MNAKGGFLPFLELGGAGGICVYTHLAGPRVQEIGAPLPLRQPGRGTGDRRRAEAANRRAGGLRQPDLDQDGAQPGRLRGRRPALPLVDATPEETEKIRELLEQADVLEPAVRA